MILHLGVNDIPYSAPAPTPKPGSKARAAASSGEASTGDVAEILEAKYGVMAYFADRHGPDIAAALENSVAGAIENLILGAPPANNPFGTAEMAIEDSFRKFLDMREMDGQPGVPTAAALAGVNHRLKRNRGGPRPSFIDTGLLQSSFRAWVD